jgi:hypothetical protein
VVDWLPAAPVEDIDDDEDVDAPAAPVDDALEVAPPAPAGLPDSSAGPQAHTIQATKPIEALRITPSIGTA